MADQRINLKQKYDIVVYGMPIYKIGSKPYGGLYGNATRAFGLANNFSKMGLKTALVVQNDFSYEPSDYLSQDLYFIYENLLSEFTGLTKTLLISCTNISSFDNIFKRNPFIGHPNKFFVCCFNSGEHYPLGNLINEMFGITFNNAIQKKIWDKCRSKIPSHVVSYGVDEFDYVENSIKPVTEDAAIWIGEIRQRDVLEKIVSFAEINNECPVNIITRKIFDQQIPSEQFGGVNNPFADFRNKNNPDEFNKIIGRILNKKIPLNLKYLGIKEGENHQILGFHTIGLDFSRYPLNNHDNTKVLDYLRSGLAVISEEGSMSARFVNQINHGFILPIQPNLGDFRKSFNHCKILTSFENRCQISTKIKARYGWDKISSNVIRIMEEDERCRHLIKKRRALQLLLLPASKSRQLLSKLLQKKISN